ncbi:unnamed protein product [Arabis nemorensis]|uniref:Uncharacterized protein n=1 Tax=Arabis nemorensis TaxID=586526 RepID=A0A565AUV5_9BRAS|nr:unnamed protein product [Arabis nemorensis]
MEIETHDSIPAKPLVKVAFRLGTESYTIDANKGTTVLEQLVSMKEESMRILKEFITNHNVSDDVADDVVESLSDDEGEGEDPLLKCPVKSKKTKI